MYLDELNEKQLEVVGSVDGPVLVIAGPGSGKTKTLTSRIAYMVDECGISPYNILAITFTKKASLEMSERINLMISGSIFVSTFHSFGNYILKKHITKLGYKSNFTILDASDSKAMLKIIIKDFGYDIDVNYVKNFISNNKNAFISPEGYLPFVCNEEDELKLDIYTEYENRLKKCNSVDFDDLLLLPVVLFQKYADVLDVYQERFKYISVDEFQDTNEVQNILVMMLASKYKNILVVGDDCQSIYSWRGSDFKFILEFEKKFKGCNTIYLEQNYRSTSNIVNASNKIISYNTVKKDKKLFTANDEGEGILYKTCFSEKDEAYYVSQRISELIEQGLDYKDICVLYRTNAQSRNIEEEFLISNIPYKIVGSVDFYNRKEIKDILAYLRLIYNFSDDISLLRVINVPKRKIGNVSLSNYKEKSINRGCSLFDALDSGSGLEFKKMIMHFKEVSENISTTELIDYILNKSGMRSELEDGTAVNLVRLENLEEFKSISFQFEQNYGIINLEDFLTEVTLVSDLSIDKEEFNVVTLMTIHSSKGLEFNNVFLVGMEEGIFPHFNCCSDNNKLEEERRLCYVAITRAKFRLWLVNASSRILYGKKQVNIPSRFITEIGLNKNSIDNVLEVTMDYQIGEKIYFDLYGEGIIVEVTDKVLSVAFSQKFGIRKLMKGHRKIIKR